METESQVFSSDGQKSETVERPQDNLEPEPSRVEDTGEEHSELTPGLVVENLERKLLETFEQAGIPITPERWKLLLPEVDYLDDTQFKQQPAIAEAIDNGVYPKRINALVSRDGRVIVSEDFLKLNETQQEHVLAHEASHRLTWLLRSSGSSAYQEIARLIDGLDSSEVSYYVAYIEKDYRQRAIEGHKTISEAGLVARLHEEKSAEILAQYLTGRGKFSEMMESKLLKFSNDPSEKLAEWLKQPGAQELWTELESFDQDPPPAAEQQEAFFTKNPEFRPHYELYLKLQALFNDREQIDKTFDLATVNVEMEYDFLEYDELASPYQIGEESIAHSPQIQASKSAAGPNLFNFVFYSAL